MKILSILTEKSAVSIIEDNALILSSFSPALSYSLIEKKYVSVSQVLQFDLSDLSKAFIIYKLRSIMYAVRYHN